LQKGKINPATKWQRYTISPINKNEKNYSFPFFSSLNGIKPTSTKLTPTKYRAQRLPRTRPTGKTTG